MDSFFSIQKLSATGAFCPERKAFFISIYARTINLAGVSSPPSLAEIQLPRGKNAYRPQPRGGNDYRFPPMPAQITTMPARMHTAAMPAARLMAAKTTQI
jgi:hypothetical protein